MTHDRKRMTMPILTRKRAPFRIRTCQGCGTSSDEAECTRYEEVERRREQYLTSRDELRVTV